MLNQTVITNKSRSAWARRGTATGTGGPSRTSFSLASFLKISQWPRNFAHKSQTWSFKCGEKGENTQILQNLPKEVYSQP